MDAAARARSTRAGGAALPRGGCRARQLGRAAAAWSAAVAAGAAAWTERLDEVRRQFRAGAWLDLLGPAIHATGPAADRLERVAAGAGVVITTGQQPGLFGGPL